MIPTSSAADRQGRNRRYRARKREGTLIIPVPVTKGHLDALIEDGLHNEDDRLDRDKISGTLEFILDAYEAGALEIDPDKIDAALDALE